MPHIILEGTPNLEALHRDFQPVTAQPNGWLVKLTNCFRSQNGRVLLLEAVAGRSGFVQTFYVLAEHKGDQVTVRIDPHTNVDKNEGVKRTLVVVRDLLVRVTPALKQGKTNLPEDYLCDGGGAG